MSTLIELTVADNEHEDIAIVWHAHQSYSGLGALGIWAKRSRHGVAVRSVPGGNKTNRTIPHEDIQMCQDSGTRGASFLTGGFYKFIYGTRCIFSLQTIKFIIPHGTLDKFSMCRKTKRWAC